MFVHFEPTEHTRGKRPVALNQKALADKKTK